MLPLFNRATTVLREKHFSFSISNNVSRSGSNVPPGCQVLCQLIVATAGLMNVTSSSSHPGSCSDDPA